MDDHQVKVGVYNLYWSTFGGGELQAGGVVDALSDDFEVEMLGPEPIDLGAMRERLGLRLRDVSFRRISRESYAASFASADYHLFVNHTFRSTAPSLAAHGMYFVMFPHRLESTPLREAVRRAGRPIASPGRLLGGVQPWAIGGDRLVGPTELQVRPDVRRVSIELSSERPEVVRAAVATRSATVATHIVEGSIRIDLDVDGANVLLTPTVMGTDLRADDAVRIDGVWIDGERIDASPRSLRQRFEAVRPGNFVDTYDRFVSNSPYTHRWTGSMWHVDTEVITPGIRARQPLPKEQLIVSVGRFFGEQSGHSKRQLDLVKAFRTMVEQGLTGWRLVLVGGCTAENRDYAMAVRKEAAGLPVEVRFSAPGAVVDELLGKAAIYWHAAGLGADLERHPERAEHFGLAPLEAMSARAVPVVFDAAGPADVVDHGANGFTYRTIDELIGRTRWLMEHPSERDTMGLAAQQSASAHTGDRFEQRVRDLARSITQA